MNDQTYCKKWENKKAEKRNREKDVQYIERQKASASTPLWSIGAINIPVEYIDQEHLSHLPFEVRPNAGGLLWTAILSEKCQTARQTLIALTEYYRWIPGWKRNWASAVRDGAALQFRGRNEREEMDTTRTERHTQVGKQRGHCVSERPGSSPYWFPWEHKTEWANRWSPQRARQHILLAFTTGLCTRGANTELLMKRHAGMRVLRKKNTPAITICLPLRSCWCAAGCNRRGKSTLEAVVRAALVGGLVAAKGCKSTTSFLLELL